MKKVDVDKIQKACDEIEKRRQNQVYSERLKMLRSNAVFARMEASGQITVNPDGRGLSFAVREVHCNGRRLAVAMTKLNNAIEDLQAHREAASE